MKKLLSFALALALCLGMAVPAFAADTLEIHWVDDSIRVFDGNAIVFSGGLLSVQKKDTEEWGYIDANGQWVNPSTAEYDSFSGTLSDGMRTITKDNKWGFMDENGQVIVPPTYDWVQDFSEGLAAVAVSVQGQGRKWGYIDKAGKEIIPPKYDEVESFSEGVAAVSITGEDWVGRWGLIDKTGREIIPPTLEYGQIGAFSNGLAPIGGVDTLALIDKTGKIIVAPQTKYQQLQPLPCGLIYATAYDQTSGVLGGIGVLNSEGQEIIPPKYDQVQPFFDGLARVRVNNGTGEDGWSILWKWGYLDTAGREIVPPQYDSAFDFSDGLARVGMKNETAYDYGYIDTTGQLVIPMEYESADDFSEGLARVGIRDENRNLKYVYIDKTGQIVISGDFNASGSFSEGLAQVSRDGKEGYIDKTGSVVIPLQYDEVSPFSDGLAKVRVGDMVNGKFGLINKSGEVILPAEYDLIGEFSEGLTWVKSGERFGMIRNPYWTAPDTPDTPEVPQSSIAYASTQTVLIDGKPVEFQAYALRDANGGDTNYIKLRDVAYALNGTAAQFEVGWDGAVNIETGKPYTPTGTEMSTPFSGDRAYTASTAETRVNGQPAALDAIVLTDDNGGTYTYYKLRDLGTALGFTVDWSAETGITIQTK